MKSTTKIDRLFSVPMALLYLVSFFLAFVATNFGLRASLGSNGVVYSTFLTLIYLMVFVIVTTLRPLLLDFTSGLEYRERFGIFVLHLVIFGVAMSLFKRSNIIVGLAFLNIPLMLFLLRPPNFTLFFGNNCLIVIFGLNYSGRANFFTLTIFVMLLLTAFIMDE